MINKLCLLLFSTSLFLAACGASSPAPTAVPGSGPDLFDTPWDDRSLFQAGLVSSEQPARNELAEASVYHLEFNIADEIYRITGTEAVRYTNAEEVALSEVQLRLFPNILGGKMSVSNLSVDAQPVTPRLSLQDSLLIVPLATPLEPKQSLILNMEFELTVPQDIERGYGLLGYFDGVLALAHAYPIIAVYDDEGWNAEIPAQYGDVTYTDASFFLAKITGPSNLTLVTSGHQIGHTQAGEFQTLGVASGPARDFYLAASSGYEEMAETFGEVTIRSYAPKGFAEGSRLAMESAARALEDFNSRYASFPYTELDIVATPTQSFGIEYPGIIALASRIYAIDEQLDGIPVSILMESTVAHEVAHQWFYNLVGDDQLDDPWLDESLAQFAMLQYYADEYGANGERGLRNSLEARWARVDRANIPIGLPVAAYTGREYGAIVYGRGALFFVALKEEMGTEAFDAFLKEYVESLSWKIATPEILQSLAEKHCGCELDGVFAEWVY